MSKRPLTQSQAIFAQTVHANIQRSTFLRPSSLKTTFNCGKLVPVYVDEVLPGDSRKIDLKMLARLSTPLFPTMDNIDLEFYAFFVPNRLVWNGWEELNGENKTGAWTPAQEPALVPEFDAAGEDNNQPVTVIRSKGIGDYMRLPVGMDLSSFGVSALPFRAYALIWNEWFRDENLQAPVPINKGNFTSGSGNVSEYKYLYNPNADLLSVNKFHDYFTSALPAPQKGDSPLLPVELNQVIPVVTATSENSASLYPRTPLLFRTSDTQSSARVNNLAIKKNASTPGDTDPASAVLREQQAYAGLTEDDLNDINVWPSNLVADGTDLGNLSSTTISELRTLFQIQKLYEKDARGGKLLCLHVKKIAEKIWKALCELIRGEGFCQPQRIVSEII